MRFCIVSQYYPPDPGGAATRAWNLAHTLTHDGHSVVVVAAQPHYPDGPTRSKLPSSYTECDGVAVIRVPAAPLSHSGGPRHLVHYFFFALVSGLQCTFKIRHTDVTWCVSPNYLSLVPGLLSRTFHRSKVILETVDIWPEALVTSGYLTKGLVSSAIRTLCVLSYRLSDCITTLTQEMREAIGRSGIPTPKVLLLPNSIDPFVVDAAKSAGPRPTYFGERFVVLYSGNIGPVYDFDVLVEAAARIKDNDILLVIRGSGERAKEVMHRAVQAKIPNLLVLGPSSRRDALHHVAWSDICVLPMRAGYEQSASFPIKLLEYLALSKPVVALAEGAIGNFISNYRTGLVLRPGDYAGLADAIVRMKNNPALVKTLGDNASKLASSYSGEAFERGIAHVISHLIENGH